MRGILAHGEALVRSREERDAAMIAVIMESQNEFKIGMEQVFNEVRAILAEFLGTPKVINGNGQGTESLPAQQQASGR